MPLRFARFPRREIASSSKTQCCRAANRGIREKKAIAAVSCTAAEFISASMIRFGLRIRQGRETDRIRVDNAKDGRVFAPIPKSEGVNRDQKRESQATLRTLAQGRLVPEIGHH
jgi:hypothetical protein